jgi:hypothetical protein
MPSIEEIQQYLTGAWRMMTGKPDGLKLLDISADGFWNSFFAIVVALPALIVGWVGIANELGELGGDFGGRLSIVLRLAVIDMLAWVIPLLGLGLVARQVGIADRYVHFVVASNWASVVLVWLMLPLAILNLLVPGAVELNDALSLLVFLAALVLTWRMTNAVLAKGPAIATAVFVAVLFVSLFLILSLQGLFGLEGAQVSG